jgi:sigma-B regulation protein RsbU (phosphoserine phosphatase)
MGGIRAREIRSVLFQPAQMMGGSRELLMQNKKLILIVDDDPDFLSSLKAVMESNGFMVFAAESGSEGMRLFNEHTPDLVLCDIMIEKIDSGIRLAREIRERNKYVPVYLLSDIGGLTAANIDIHRIGCNGSLQKPCNPGVLLRIVRQELEKN